jgi:hypothetical protein
MMDDAGPLGAPHADGVARGETGAGGSDAERSQAGDLVGDRELGTTEPLGEAHRHNADDPTGIVEGTVERDLEDSDQA